MSAKTAKVCGLGYNTPQRKPGPKKGSRHPGMFTKNDPRINRNGWSNVQKQRSVEDRFQAETDKAIEVLKTIMADKKSPAQARLAAAREILDRGYGKPVDRQVIANLNTNKGKEIKQMTEAELLQVIADNSIETASESEAIESFGKLVSVKTTPPSDLK